MLKVLSSLLFLPAFLVILAAAQSPVEDTVVDSAGKAVAGATVILRRADGSSLQETKSNIAGRFQFSAIEGGAHGLRAEVAGCYPSRYEFVLRPRQSFSMTIESEVCVTPLGGESCEAQVQGKEKLAFAPYLIISCYLERR